MGNPFITLSERPSVGRIGASILKGIGIDEWIAYSINDYINKAIELAKDLENLSKIRHDLRSKMNKSYMMNGRAFTQNLENNYQLMWDTYIKKT